MRRTSESTPSRGRELRLVRDVESRHHGESSADDARARSDQVRAARRVHREWEVGAENRAAAGMSAFDARWAMATRVSDALEGGRAAILRPEARARLVSTAGRMGLRPFDANMVIAIVQDAARRGEPALDNDTADRLTVVGAASERAARKGPGLVLILSTALAVLWASLLLLWILG